MSASACWSRRAVYHHRSCQQQSSSGGRHFRLRQLLSCTAHGPDGEDRWALSRTTAVLCDGASEGYDGAGWALILSHALCRNPDPERGLRLARVWYARSLKLKRSYNRTTSGRDDAARPETADSTNAGSLPPAWLQALSAARGSWSTALIAKLSPGGRWLQLSELGDTVAFLLDNDCTLRSFPLESAEAFGQHPDLAADRKIAGETGTALPWWHYRCRLPARKRLRLILATDALAEYILRTAEGQLRAALWARLRACSQTDFAAWAAAEQKAGRLRSDDLTLLELSL